jgi:poly(3-hydroxybutyrate) depolymerase
MASSTGPRFRAEIAPRILDFMRSHGKANRTKRAAPKLVKGGKSA